MILSRIYFISLNLGLLRNKRMYDYVYFMKHMVNRGDVCIDIGANLGYVTVVLSKLVSTTGKVYAVEPVKPVLDVLRMNTRKLKNVEILPYALGAENKKITLGNTTLKSQGFMSSGSHFIVEDEKAVDVEFEAEMRRGSHLFSRLERLNFIKCDIEGYEVVVIPELESLISKFRPLLLIEARRESRVKMLQFFNQRSYSGYLLNAGYLYPAKPDEYWDILFIPHENEGRFEKIIRRDTDKRQ